MFTSSGRARRGACPFDLVPLAAILAVPPLAWAPPAMAGASPPDEAETPAKAVDAVVVTASRVQTALTRAPSAQVFGLDAIEASGAQTLADLLRGASGLAVSQNGAFGGVASVRLRGSASDKSLILIDGAPVNDPSQPSGGFDLSTVDLVNAQRVEVLSGPQAALWGSDAIGGVIAITSRRPQGLSLGFEAGGYGFGRATAALGGEALGGALSATAAATTAGGLSKAAGGREADGYRAVSASGAYGRDLGSDIRVDARLRFDRQETDLDGYPGPTFRLGDTADRSAFESLQAHLGFRTRAPWGSVATLSADQTALQRGQTGGDFTSGYEGRRRSLRLTFERGGAGDPFGLATGIEVADERASLSDGGRFDRDLRAAFLAVRFRPAPFAELGASVRRDEGPGPDATTARASGTLDLGSNWSFSASWGQGFKRPTLSQSACDFCSPPGPALDLRPEEARGADAALVWRPNERVEIVALGWRLDVKDQIDFAFDPATFGFRYVNLKRARASGAEIRGVADLGAGWRARAAFWTTEAFDAQTGRRLLRQPPRQARLSLDRDAGRLRGSLALRYESDQADVDLDGFSPRSRPGFVTADLAVRFRLSPDADLTFRVENLADRRYFEAYGFSTPGRWARLGVRFGR